MKAWPVALGMLFTCGFQSAGADQVYRCGPEGRIYQNAPCKQGKAVDVSDPRTADQQKAARSSAKADARLATELERDRLAREAGLPPVKASGFNARPTPSERAASAPAKSKQKRKSESAKAASAPQSLPALVPKAKGPATETRKP